MRIEINKSKNIEVNESFLIVKDNKLYNTETKKFEGLDGDIIQFHIITNNGTKSWVRGSVDGYTCGNIIKLRGVDKPYTADSVGTIERVSKITDYQDESSEDLELILSA